MDDEIIRAYLWRDVIRLGFSPSSTKERKCWLREYQNSLRYFWEVDSYPASLSEERGIIKAQINCDKLNLCLDYEIKPNSNFKASFLFLQQSNVELILIHDVDDNYYTFPDQLWLTMDNRRSMAVRNYSQDHAKAVMDGLIFHPAVHLHIASPIDNHEIRIGGGINNPFQYLFQLRYQFCPDEIKRQAERDRLIALFFNAVRANSPIAASNLMAQPRNLRTEEGSL
jgi:hypothetical protein